MYKLSTITLALLTVFTSANAMADVKKSDAIDIAINFVDQKRQDHVTNVNVENYIVNDVTNLNNVTQAYEVSLYDKNNKPIGYVNIPVKEGYGVVTGYSFSGLSPSNTLKETYKDVVQPANQDFTIVGFARGAVGLATAKNMKTAGGNLSDLKRVGNYSILSDRPEYVLQDLDANKKKALPNTLMNSSDDYDLLEEKELRESLINGIKLPKKAGETTTKKISNIVAASRYMTPYASVGGAEGKDKRTKFSPYNQEKRRWSRGYCFAGCTPVAFAIVLEYWDGEGYPKLVGNRLNNTHPDDKHRHVRAMIDTLRNDLKTVCHSDLSAGTSISDTPNALKYIQSRGYNAVIKNSSYGKADEDAWNMLKSEIDAGRPVVSAIAVSGIQYYANHSVVVYGYKDAPGQADDEFYYIAGWGSNKSKLGKRPDYFMATKVQIY